ncbi:hypothetical protein SAMN05444365_101450 [Micromonospora pattaloongensis]|uniref:Uncharacterized protein n=1 Tax=Micromonospora pattaloongensis TaxID=405436 RepID=A0A1H3GJY7_9ACTN|nr:hypothetical protein [Micromonospora pattaloongensis]SDY03662.1 hypothetical protein SAMN05444365_101450 [Micromonospora pattaloongensis]
MPLSPPFRVWRPILFWPLLLAAVLATVLVPLLLAGMASGGSPHLRPEPRTMVYWAAGFLTVFAFTVGARHAVRSPAATGRAYLAGLARALAVAGLVGAPYVAAYGAVCRWVFPINDPGEGGPGAGREIIWMSVRSVGFGLVAAAFGYALGTVARRICQLSGRPLGPVPLLVAPLSGVSASEAGTVPPQDGADAGAAARKPLSRSSYWVAAAITVAGVMMCPPFVSHTAWFAMESNPEPAAYLDAGQTVEVRLDHAGEYGIYAVWPAAGGADACRVAGDDGAPVDTRRPSIRLPLDVSDSVTWIWVSRFTAEPGTYAVSCVGERAEYFVGEAPRIGGLPGHLATVPGGRVPLLVAGLVPGAVAVAVIALDRARARRRSPASAG